MKLLLIGLLAAQADPSVVEGRGFQIDPLREGLSAAAMIAISLTLDREKKDWDGLSPCKRETRVNSSAEQRLRFEAMADDEGLCQALPIPFFDRWVTSQDSETAATLSDFGVLGLALAPFMFSALDTGANSRPAKEMGEDALVGLQAFGATLLAVQVIKVAATRPRPLTYNQSFGKKVRFHADSRLSFPSGHAALSFSGASVVSVMLLDRYGWNPGAAVAIIGLYGIASGVALMRILAGKHFLSDVTIGAAIGTLFGLVIPIFHLEGDKPANGQLTVPGNRRQPLLSLGFSF